MLRQVAEGVLIHRSELLENNAVVVQGPTGALLIDPGLTEAEMTCLADDLRRLGQHVEAGFATHPDWDHVLWHPEYGDAPRYGTDRCAAHVREVRAAPDWKRASLRGCRRRSPRRHRWTCTASSPVCRPGRHRFPGTALLPRSSSTRHMRRGMRRC